MQGRLMKTASRSTTDLFPVFTSPEGKNETMRAYDSVLAQWPVPYTELDVPTSFGDTHVLASGPETAPSVILLHALFATATSWYRTVGSLSQYFRTYAIDIPGEANKSRPTRLITSLEDYVRWFTELTDGLHIAHTDLIGNSFGGFIATYIAMRAPERIRRLVLIGPAATIHSMLPFYGNMFIPKALFLLFPWLPGQNRSTRYGIDWMHAGLPADTTWTKLFALTMRHGRMTSRVFPRVYTHGEFAMIKAPTLLILGDRERIYSVDKAVDAAKRLMPSIQVRVIPGAHHITALAQPELVNASLLEFLQPDRSDKS
jgi:pimeloyl-ACP methyl ester carboxylesterase